MKLEKEYLRRISRRGSTIFLLNQMASNPIFAMAWKRKSIFEQIDLWLVRFCFSSASDSASASAPAPALFIYRERQEMNACPTHNYKQSSSSSRIQKLLSSLFVFHILSIENCGFRSEIKIDFSNSVCITSAIEIWERERQMLRPSWKSIFIWGLRMISCVPVQNTYYTSTSYVQPRIIVMIKCYVITVMPWLNGRNEMHAGRSKATWKLEWMLHIKYQGITFTW